MPNRCNVFGCRSNFDGEIERVYTFSLPKNQDLRQKWLRNCCSFYGFLCIPLHREVVTIVPVLNLISENEDAEVLSKIQDTYVPFLKKLIAFLEKNKKATPENLNKLNAIYSIFTTAPPQEQVDTFHANEKKLKTWYNKSQKTIDVQAKSKVFLARTKPRRPTMTKAMSGFSFYPASSAATFVTSVPTTTSATGFNFGQAASSAPLSFPLCSSAASATTASITPDDDPYLVVAEDVAKINIQELRDKISAQLTEHEKDKKELKQKLEEAEKRCTAYSSENLELQKKWKTDHEQYELDKQHLKTALENKEMENYDLKQRLEKNLRRKDSQLVRYRQEIEIAEGQLEHFKERLTQVERIKRKLQDHVEKLEKDKKMIFEKLNVTEEKFAEKVTEFQRLENLRRRFWGSSILEEAKTSSRLDYAAPVQNVSAVRDATENTLVGALYNTEKGIEFVKGEDLDFQLQSSLKKIRDRPEDQVYKLPRCNSPVPRRLGYPALSDFTPATSQPFNPYRRSGKNGAGESSRNDSNSLKDRVIPQSSCSATPPYKYTSSFHDYFSFDRSKRTGPVRARPT